MAKGQKFLKVTSILMIIGGALSGKIPCRHSSNVTPLLENAAFTTKSPQRKR